MNSGSNTDEPVSCNDVTLTVHSSEIPALKAQGADFSAALSGQVLYLQDRLVFQDMLIAVTHIEPDGPAVITAETHVKIRSTDDPILLFCPSCGKVQDTIHETCAECSEGLPVVLLEGEPEASPAAEIHAVTPAHSAPPSAVVKAKARQNKWIPYAVGVAAAIAIVATFFLAFYDKSDRKKGSPLEGPAEAITGVLTIKSNPSNAEIYLNNTHYGYTSKTIKGLDAGRYSLTLRKKGYQDREKTVLVSKGQDTSIFVNLTAQTKTEKTIFITNKPGTGSGHLRKTFGWSTSTNANGSKITDVYGDPAKGLGIQKGDVIKKVNGKKVTHYEQYVNAALEVWEGKSKYAIFEILHNGKHIRYRLSRKK
jgi:hypothetical protein